ncbi:MAG: hypothetical protein V4598_09190 [Bdellovibrionota bacterium]
MIRILSLLFLFSCAHKVSTLPTEAKVTTRTFPSAKEARNNVRNKWNYIHFLFEQSHDPYYGTPKWPATCLAKNVQGKLTENQGNIFFISHFLLNEKDEVGHCQGKATEVIFLHCQDSLNVQEIHCAPGACASAFQSQSCPLIK